MPVDNASPESVKVYDVKACRNCAQSKTRCISTHLSSTSCDRCYRLKKQCIPQTPHERKPRAATGRKNRSRIAELEKRLDQLSRTVHHDKTSEGSGAEAISTPPVVSIGQEYPVTPASLNVLHTPTPSQGLTGSSSLQDVIATRNEDLEALIEVYRTQCARFFPFVSIPDCSVDVWREKHPYLLCSVCLVASYKARMKQAQIGQIILEDLCTKVMLRGEKSLDILQGLLVYLSWYYAHFAVQRLGQSQVSNLLSLCTALIADLGFNRPSHRNDRRRLIFDETRKSYGFAETSERRTSDEKLALLGCFYVSVAICVCMKRLDAIPYTSHIDDVRQSFLADGDTLHSAYIDCLVRIQAIAYKIDKSFPYTTPNSVWQFTAPIGMHVESLRAELASFRDSVPTALKTEPLVELHICTAEIYLHEVSLYDLQWQGPSTTQSSQRLDMLYACLQSTKNYFEAFLAIPEDQFRTMCWYAFSQLAFALIVCSRLSLLELPGWNLKQVRKELDFSIMLGLIINKMEGMNELAKAEWLNGQDDIVWFRVAKKISRVKIWFDAQKAEASGERMRDQMQQTLQQMPIEMSVFNEPTLGLMGDLDMGGGLMNDWFLGWPELTN